MGDRVSEAWNAFNEVGETLFEWVLEDGVCDDSLSGGESVLSEFSCFSDFCGESGCSGEFSERGEPREKLRCSGGDSESPGPKD